MNRLKQLHEEAKSKREAISKSEQNIIELDISKDIIEKAKERLIKVENIQRSDLSKFGSEHNRILVGYIGEELLMQYLGIEKSTDDFNFDLYYRNKKLEAKTISCKYKPPATFLCTVNSYNLDGVHKQNADYYVFLRILNDFSKGWILGFIGCKEFFEKGTFKGNGTDFGEFQFVKANATVLEIYELTDIKDIKTI